MHLVLKLILVWT